MTPSSKPAVRRKSRQAATGSRPSSRARAAAPLTLERNAGQALIVGFEGTEMSPGLASLLARVQPAGVVLFSRNIVNAAQTYRLLGACAEAAGAPLFTCVDLEGGLVDRFRQVFGRTPSAADVFASGDKRLFRRHGRLIGDCCRALGFNTDFAPVVDLAFTASSAVMSSRAVSRDPEAVSLYAREFMAGLAQAKVLGALKHFPGLGGAALDTHHELPSVARTQRELWEQDMAPFRTLRRDAPMVLVGHANYPKLTRDATPASLSPTIISAWLRKKIGYRGLVVSDDLEMGGVLQAAAIEDAAHRFLLAGGDLCLICRREDYVLRTFESLVERARKSPALARRLAEVSRRVLAFRRSRQFPKAVSNPPPPARIDELKRSLWEFSERLRLGAIAPPKASSRPSR